jgi:hypothetical protein
MASQVGRAGDHHAAVVLQRLHQAGAAQHLGEQAFGGQEQDGEVGGVRRRDVLGEDLLASSGSRLERLAGRLDGHLVGASCASSRRS